jgi:hypothetical protein
MQGLRGLRTVGQRKINLLSYDRQGQSAPSSLPNPSRPSIVSHHCRQANNATGAAAGISRTQRKIDCQIIGYALAVGKETEYMQACSQDTNRHVLTLHAGMYHHYMLVGKIGTWWLLRSVHACMYQKPGLDGRISGVVLRWISPVDVAGYAL